MPNPKSGPAHRLRATPADYNLKLREAESLTGKSRDVGFQVQGPGSSGEPAPGGWKPASGRRAEPASRMPDRTSRPATCEKAQLADNYWR